MREVIVSRGEASRRLDKYLLKYMNSATPGFIYKMLRKKRIKLNSARAEGNETLCEGDIITLYLSDETVSGFISERTAPPPEGGLDIVFEDDDILLINKPAGMLVHSDSPTGTGDLASRLVYYLESRGLLSNTFTPAPSNRLDRNTSGIVICGKHPAAVRALNEARSEKLYLTVVSGEVKKPELLTGYIFKNQSNNESIVSASPIDGSKEIITEYSPIGWGGGITLLCVKLITGKSHQIRAQLKAAGLPILGDPKYGDLLVNRRVHLKHQLLHAAGFTFLDNGSLLQKYNHKTYWAPAPAYFSSFINKKIGVFCDESYYFGSGIRNKVIPSDFGQTQSSVKNSGESNY